MDSYETIFFDDICTYVEVRGDIMDKYIRMK